MLAQILFNAEGAFNGAFNSIFVLMGLVEWLPSLSIGSDREQMSRGVPCAGVKRESLFETQPCQKQLAGLIKHCSRVLHWSRLACAISRYTRSHDRAPCPCSMVTIVKKPHLLPCKPFHSYEKGDDRKSVYPLTRVCRSLDNVFFARSFLQHLHFHRRRRS